MAEILIGLVSGIISGTGMGGGTILIFLLTFVIGMEQHVAQATNLIFFIPTSIVAIIVNLKNKNIDIPLAIIISVFGILGAIIGANISINIDVRILRKGFGVFLAIISLNEIYSIIKRYKKPKLRDNKWKKRGDIMKFIKGIMIGGLVTTGLVMMYAENGRNKKKMMKKGKQMAKKIGII